MTTNISDKIIYWVKCSNQLWTQWFSKRENGLHEFVNVERALLNALVLDELKEQGYQLPNETPFSFIHVTYPHDMKTTRTICTQQKAGNIYGQLELVTLMKDKPYDVRSIDTTGSMLDGEPYVEIMIDQRFILEPIKNLTFLAKNNP